MTTEGVRPGIGRIVHYVSHGTPVRPDGSQAYTAECRAAIITEVLPEWKDNAYAVGLAVLNPSGLFFARATYDEWDNTTAAPSAEPRGGSWHWPERLGDGWPAELLAIEPREIGDGDFA